MAGSRPPRDCCCCHALPCCSVRPRDTAALLSQDDAPLRSAAQEALLGEITAKLVSVAGGRAKADFWPAFERTDQPIVKYDFAVADTDPPMITSMLTMVSVTTFLAGFAVNDFGSFEAESWDIEGRKLWSLIIMRAYLLMMAFVSANTMYLSIAGVMIGAAYHRTRNQLRFWETTCKTAVEPVTAALAKGNGLKGERRDSYREAYTQTIRSNPDWADAMNAAGKASQKGGYALPGHSLVWLPDEGAWHIWFPNPCHAYAEMAKQLIRGKSFPASVILYIASQALKALRNEQLPIVCVVLGILIYWMASLLWTLSIVMSKLSD